MTALKPSDEGYISPYRRKLSAEELAAREAAPETVARHVAQTRAYMEMYGVEIGDHDIMEAQPIQPEEAPRRWNLSGKDRAMMRLARKREANEAIPHIDRPDSRQVKRAKKQAAAKAMGKHMNEHVKGLNRKRRMKNPAPAAKPEVVNAVG